MHKNSLRETIKTEWLIYNYQHTCTHNPELHRRPIVFGHYKAMLAWEADRLCRGEGLWRPWEECIFCGTCGYCG